MRKPATLHVNSAWFVGVLILCAALAVAAAQSNQSSLSRYDQQLAQYQALADAPEKARLKRNPMEGDRTAVLAGRKLFQQHCAECHGSTAEGGNKGPSLRVEEVQLASPGALFWVLTNGVVRRGMPVWSKLPEPERWQIVTYLKSLGISPPRPPVKPNSL